MEALEASSVKGIICTIGGEDSIRINPYLNKDIIANNPKVFMGYSDATATHMMFLQAGVTSFYGPTIMAGFGENAGLPAYMKESVENSIFKNNPVGSILPNKEGWTNEFLDWAKPENQTIRRKLLPPVGPVTLQGEGNARGALIGGCVEVLEMLRGTEYWPDLSKFENAILFLEIAEKEFTPTQFGRTLRCYGVMGILHKVAAIITGRPGVNTSPEDFNNYNQVLQKVVRDEFGLSDLPLIVNMDFGHTDPIFTIPYGLRAEINCLTAELTILENAVI